MKSDEFLILIGPNRRSERTIIEQQIVLTGEELAALSVRLNHLITGVTSILDSWSVSAHPWISQDEIRSDDICESFARIFTGIALALQNAAGHRVHEQGILPDRAGRGVWAWFEYEHDEVGEEASQLAFRLLTRVEPVLVWEGDAAEAPGDLASMHGKFMVFARSLALPADAEAIVAAAQHRDIPCAKLERDPYKGVQGGFRVRPNALLKLGHCRYQQIVDGTICISRSAKLLPLLSDREALRQMLVEMRVAVPLRDPQSGNCMVARRAIRAAERIGYPVVVRPAGRSRGQGITLDVRDAEGVRSAVETARRIANHVVVEAMVTGQSYRMLIADHEVLGVICAGRALPLGTMHESTLALASHISSQLDMGLALMDVVTVNPGRPLTETGGAVVDVDLAPQIDWLSAEVPDLLHQAATGFMRWIFPVGSTSRIPIVAVTGTNGKTTTCHMICAIMQAGGRHTGMVCSDGIYKDGKFEAKREDIGHGAHHRVFEYPDVDFAIFEEYFGRIARLGFSYHWCNVALCTNVTEDHLGRIGTYTPEQMAELKFAVIERAREAAVLNADDPYCLQMAERATASRICLVSCHKSAEQLAMLVHRPGCFVVIEQLNSADWIVIHDGELKLPIIAVDDIPATFAGRAMHNASNAMHAAAACYLAGAAIEDIASSLGSFCMGIESTPGRLNIYDGLPFRVIMDYAHNADGYRKLCAFVDSQQVSGRKIVMMSFSGDRQEKAVIAAAAEMAGHFDHYVCRNYSGTRGRRPEEIPALLKSGLLRAGVPERAVDTVEDATAAVQFSLELARKGDLLVLLPGEDEFVSVWSRMTEFNSRCTGPSGPNNGINQVQGENKT